MKKTITRIILVFSVVPNLAIGAESPTGGLECFGTPTNQSRPFERLENHFKNFPRSPAVTQNFRVQMANVAFRTVKDLCQKKRELDSAAQALLASAKTSTTGDNSGCNAFNNNNPRFKAIADSAKSYSDALGKANVNYNHDFDHLKKQESEEVFKRKDSKILEKEYEKVWGLNLNGVADNCRLEDGFFSKVITQIRTERNGIEKYLDPQKNQAELVAQSGLTCGSLGKPVQDADQDVKAGGHKPGAKATVPGSDTQDSPFPKVPDQGPIPPEKETPIGEFPPPPEKITGDGTKPPVDQSGGVGSWVSNHKGALLIGAGTAAVVGGVLLYKHNQDKKKADAQDLEIGALQNTVGNSGSSVSTGTSSTTQTVLAPADATLQVTGFPTEATVGAPISPITVRVIGANGAPLTDNGIEISLSCTSSCSISGTLTKTTVGGQVEFGGISFTSASTGVQLRLSSPGINSVASPSSFIVHDAAE